MYDCNGPSCYSAPEIDMMPDVPEPPQSPEWLEVYWTDENHKPVKHLIFQRTECAEVLNLPFPSGAVAREPVVPFSGSGNNKFEFFRTSLVKSGDEFREYINQAYRDFMVMAVDSVTGEYLAEYQMPNGSTCIRIYGWDNGVRTERKLSYKALSKKWRKLVETAGIPLIEHSQSSSKPERWS